MLDSIARIDDKMKLSRTYVGFGFGPIQAGLLLYEAHRSGAFDRMVVAEVVPEVVSAVRAAGGSYCVNIARADGIERARVTGVEIENPNDAADRDRLICAIAQAREIGTAVPSVRHYVSSAPGSLHKILAAGLSEKVRLHGPRAVIYASENHNHAAEILADAVLADVPATQRTALRRKVRFLNTVIGKMSGLISDPDEVAARRLAPITEELARAFLVESFNRILISRIRFPGPRFRRGIAAFEEKPDLLPFEEAKLFGHNATHAVAAYVAWVAGLQHIADLPSLSGALSFLRAAFVDESGAALISRYQGVDPLFTPEGYAAYADDLLARMVNPHLGDTVERVGRDPERKLGWDDRLIGTIRLVLSQGIRPLRYSFGAAAALACLWPDLGEHELPLAARLDSLWSTARPVAEERQAVVAWLEDGLRRLRAWRSTGLGNLG